MKKIKSTPNLLHQCTERLTSFGLNIAFAESMTAGRVCSEFALAPNASKFLKGGVICYDTATLQLLEVSPILVQRHTVASPEVTKAITIGLSKIFNANISIGCTGVKHPDRNESEAKPNASIYIHGMRDGETIFSDHKLFDGSQTEIIEQTVMRTMKLILTYLSNVPEAHIPEEIKAEDETSRDKKKDNTNEWSVSWP